MSINLNGGENMPAKKVAKKKVAKKK